MVSYVLGIDIGGTFTDAFATDDAGREVEFRQLLCPGCGVALQTEVAVVADTGTRSSVLVP
jgi:N-methylhydantoinase A/oxoprolinase/acetone carboxylase beta subunit